MSIPTLAPLFSWREAVLHRDSPLSTMARFTALTLATYMNSKHSSAWPGQERLAADEKRSARSVHRDLKELERCGYLWVERRQGHTNVYHLTLPPDMMTHLVTNMTRVSSSQAQEGATGDSPPSGGPDTHVRGTPDTGVVQNMQGEVVNPAVKKGDHRALFAALCEYMGRPPQGGEGAQWGRVAKLMAQELVPPAEVLRRGALMKAKWSSIPPSVNALWNNWGQFAEGVEPESPYEAKRRAEQEMHTEAEAIRKEWADADARGSGQGPDGGA